MKKLAFYLLIIVTVVPLFTKICSAQEETLQEGAPEGFVYQAEIRNDKGRVLSNATVDLRISILSSIEPTDFVWKREYLSRTSDKFGLISVIVGDEGDNNGFSNIPWGTGPFYLFVEINDGSGYIPMADPVMLMSVPYALYANKAGSAAPISEEDPKFFLAPASSITQQNLLDWNEAYLWGDHSKQGYLKSFLESDPIFTAHPASSITENDISSWNITTGISSTDITNWNTAHDWGDHSLAGYLTEETDPIFTLSPAYNISDQNILDWNEAHLWGDHSTQGYLKSFTESDPIFTTHPAAGITENDISSWNITTGISSTDIANWNTAHGWGDHSLAGYLTEETDPIFTLSPAYNISDQNILEWNTAIDWDDLNSMNYLTTETDPVFSSSSAFSINDQNILDWNEAHLWGDHSTQGYLKNFIESDPIFTTHPAAGITETDISKWNITIGIAENDITNWNTAYSWGDHSLANYLTSESDPEFTNHPAYGISSTDISNWNTAYDWGDHAAEGYLKAEKDDDPTNEYQNLNEVLNIDNDAGDKRITNLAPPNEPKDAATKEYVDALEERIAALEQIIQIWDPQLDNDGDGYTELENDCDDDNDQINPGAIEICNDGIDNNCNGEIDELCYIDNDADNWTPAQGDCDDNNPDIHPGAIEICGDGIDQNCNGNDDEIVGCVECAAGDIETVPCYDGPPGTENVGSCTSGTKTRTCVNGQWSEWSACQDVVYPTDEICNGIDDDCDGEIDEDIDAPLTSKQLGVCAGSTQICINGIWIDNYANPNYQEIETWCDGLDNDCDGVVDEGCTGEDVDADGLLDSVDPDSTDPDSDNDGLLDGEEDINGNGSIDAGETDFLDADSDDDGISDGDEVTLGTNPLDSDSDDDGLSDGLESGIQSGISSGQSNGSVAYAGTAQGFIGDSDPSTQTDPMDPDTDNDGLCDGPHNVSAYCIGGEDLNGDGSVNSGETDPTDADTDDDGIVDGNEDLNGNGIVDSGESDPLDSDTDNDTVSDGNEDINGNGYLADDDTDLDGISNCLDPDDDDDGILTINEDVNGDGDPTNDDSDGDGVENYLDNDDDDDSVLTINDNCPLVANPDQADADGNGIGDACDNVPVNSPPTTPGISIVGQYSSEDLHCEIVTPSTDPNGDLITYIYEWSVNGEIVTGQTSNTLPNTLTAMGDIVACRVWASDGYDLSVEAVDQVTIVTDVDGDGYPAGVDCDDNDPNNWTSCASCVDSDQDGAYVNCDAYIDFYEDCDDGDADVFPGNTEVVGDGVDQDCDGNDLCYVDNDGDGHGTLSTVVSGSLDCSGPGESIYSDDCDDNDSSIHSGCDNDGDGFPEGPDCDDSNDAINPDATEIWYDGVDQNCDGLSDYDQDMDGYDSVDYGGDDCDDTDENINPGAVETWYDGIDQNCDGLNDFDKDMDTFVDAAHSGEAGGSAPNTGDCNDNDATVNPGANEIPGNDTDEDCNGFIACYVDTDNDGYGGIDVAIDCYPAANGMATTSNACSSSNSDNYDDNNTDCDDNSATVNPGATEICGNEVDDNCDGSTDEVCDSDNDGVPDYIEGSSIDTDQDGTRDYLDPDDDGDGILTIDEDVNNDGDPTNDDTDADGVENYLDNDDDGDSVLTINDNCPLIANPNQADSDGNGVGDACENDTDGDGSPAGVDCNDNDPNNWTSCASCVDVDGDGAYVNCDAYIDFDEDCDDSNADVFPGNTEVVGDGVDQDCDGNDLCYVDNDGDGHGTLSTVVSSSSDCSGPGESIYSDDCDDNDSSIHSGCDNDGDGFPEGPDCDDSNAAINPGATEIWYDGVDQNCDGLSDYDQDMDGYDSVDYGGEDCDDTDESINPGAVEIWYDGIDQNCDGMNDFDKDMDTFVDAAHTGEAGGSAPNTGDCNDNYASINPGASEIPGNDIDEDCNGFVACYEDLDNDGFGSTTVIDCHSATNGLAEFSNACSSSTSDGCDDNDTDCNDNVASAYPGAPEDCGDGIDNDCDGFIDNEDCECNPLRGMPCDGPDADLCEEGVYECDAGTNTLVCTDNTGDNIEICNGIDDDCDGTVDEDCINDADGDGSPAGVDCDDNDPNNWTSCASCVDDDGDGAYVNCDAYIDFYQDCDDSNSDVFPGNPEVVGDGSDQDCDGIDAVYCFVDNDEDGFGDNSGQTIIALDGSCDRLQGESLTNNDCDDNDATVYPGASEICDEKDNNCDGVVDEGCTGEDVDADGLLDSVDPDSTDPDSDNDGLLDGEEDINGNGSIDAGETDFLDADSDDDGISDGDEVTLGTNPLDSDSDDDGLSDGLESGIQSGISSGQSNGSVAYAGTAQGFIGDSDPSTQTDPMDPDTDNDGLCDGPHNVSAYCIGGEDLNGDGSVNSGETDPTDADTDDDGIVDGNEDLNGNGIVDSGESDPLNSDTDNDTVSDGDEDINGNGYLTDDDTDLDGISNCLDPDDDGDGILTIDEDVNGDGDPTNDDSDGDGVENYLDNDDDDDSVLTIIDNCPLVANPDQADTDGNGIGDACDNVPVNSPPTTPGISIVGQLSNENLFCEIVTPSTDPDGDLITYIYEWSVNGEIVTGQTSNTLPNTLTAVGDIVACRVWAYDGYDLSVEAVDQVTIVDNLSGSIVINEIDYDNVGIDDNEFVEIYNGSDNTIDLTGWTLEKSSNPGSNFSNVYTFSGTIASNEYMVVRDDINISFDLGLFNGPGAVRLLDAEGTIIDAVYYEGYVDPISPEGDPAVGDDGSGDFSIGRYPNGYDTDDNSVDFIVMPLTPGTSNQHGIN